MPARSLTFRSADGALAVKWTSKENANFALIGRFMGSEDFRVISLHARRDLANPADVENPNWHDIKVAKCEN